MGIHAPNPNENAPSIFHCVEESSFYSLCIEQLLLPRIPGSAQLREFGSGDGAPVIQALARTPEFSGFIRGYEVNPQACAQAQQACQTAGTRKYQVECRSFFDQGSAEYSALLANPPYIPFPDNSILLPYLHGGTDGSEPSCRLLDEPCQLALLVLSSYSNPIRIIDHARDLGFAIASFLVMPIPYGRYSSEPKVFRHIQQLLAQNQGYCNTQGYLIAGVLFSRLDTVDQSAVLAGVMRSAASEPPRT